jgi:hypothetical protein
VKTKKLTVPKVTDAQIAARLMNDPVCNRLMAILNRATDTELVEYGQAMGGVLQLLVRWVKRATFGFASVDDLQALFFTDKMPSQVKALCERVFRMVG